MGSSSISPLNSAIVPNTHADISVMQVTQTDRRGSEPFVNRSITNQSVQRFQQLLLEIFAH
jgi:hypothetical protein